MISRRLAALAAAVPLLLAIGPFVAGPALAGAGCHSGLERTASASTVHLAGSCMDPLVARVPTGTVVTFVNDDDYAHAVTGAANAWGTFDQLNQGDAVAYQFTAAGVYPFFCYIHPGMVGAIVVGGGEGDTRGESVHRTLAGAADSGTSVETPSAPNTAAATEAPTAQPTAAASASPAQSLGGVAGTTGGSTSGSGSAPLLPLVSLAAMLALVAIGAAYAFRRAPRIAERRRG